jgi:hypothetical protein
MNKTTKIVLAVSIIVTIFLISMFVIISSRNSKTLCNSFSVEKCPDECVVCPPCEICSSISCQTEEFCKNLGFDRNWYKAIEERLKASAQ